MTRVETETNADPARQAPEWTGIPWKLGAPIAAFAWFLCTIATFFRAAGSADTPRYERIAHNMLTHGVYSSCANAPLLPEIERMPGYPAFLALVRAFAPTGNQPVAVAQAALHGLTVLALFALAYALTSDRIIAALSALAWTIYPFSLYYALSLYAEPLAVFGTTVAFAGLAVYLRSASRIALAVGLLGWIVGAYTRPHIFLLPFFLIGLLVLFKRLRTRSTIRAILLVCATVSIAIAPWIIRNKATFDRFLIGSNNYLGMNVCYMSVQFSTTPEQAVAYCFGDWDPRAVMNECDPQQNLQYDRIMRHRGVEELRRHPARSVLHAFFRPMRIWFSTQMQTEGNAKLEAVMGVGTLALLPLFLGGILILWRRTRDGWLLGGACLFISLAHIPVLVSARYSMPVRTFYILAIVICAVGLYRNRRAIRQRRWRDIDWLKGGDSQ